MGYTSAGHPCLSGFFFIKVSLIHIMRAKIPFLISSWRINIGVFVLCLGPYQGWGDRALRRWGQPGSLNQVFSLYLRHK